MRAKFYAIAFLLRLSAATLLAQQPQNDPLGEHLFPPELVMQNQQAIGLNEDQKNFIKAEIQKAQARFTDLQWQLQEEMEKMIALVKESRVDEQQVLAQLEKILALEREIKRTHLGLVIRIKNRLTAEQQAQLQAIKKRMPQ